MIKLNVYDHDDVVFFRASESANLGRRPGSQLAPGANCDAPAGDR